MKIKTFCNSREDHLDDAVNEFCANGEVHAMHINSSAVVNNGGIIFFIATVVYEDKVDTERC